MHGTARTAEAPLQKQLLVLKALMVWLGKDKTNCRINELKKIK